MKGKIQPQRNDMEGATEILIPEDIKTKLKYPGPEKPPKMPFSMTPRVRNGAVEETVRGQLITKDMPIVTRTIKKGWRIN